MCKRELTQKKDRKVVRSIFFMVAAILWMIVIFLFSAQPADESTNMSHTVGKIVGRILIADFEEWEPDKQEDFASRIDFVVRKTAHAMEYAILCVLFSMAFYYYGVPARKCFWLAMLCTVGYAATDEFHQLFVPGRSGRIRDVLIDGTGAVVGGGIIYRITKKARQE